ncbi:hypothetical protein E3N88_44066 [Mikania micrantha]|uniref:Uncharacterized protein n=1 Tax=Mikania micrantha TaxID=192012 RepID=A0A5N6LD43_9ASTR|nr:hypothetical protein E3N88_44066 [Mikania micrantha]
MISSSVSVRSPSSSSPFLGTSIFPHKSHTYFSLCLLPLNHSYHEVEFICCNVLLLRYGAGFCFSVVHYYLILRSSDFVYVLKDDIESFSK